MTEKNTQVDETTNEPANEPANEAPTTADLAKNMKGWEMACALLVGVNKTLDQVTTERDAIIAAAAGGFRPSGSAERADLIEALTRGFREKTIWE